MIDKRKEIFREEETRADKNFRKTRLNGIIGNRDYETFTSKKDVVSLIFRVLPDNSRF